MDKLYIIIPAYNEEANIERVVSQWHAIVTKYGHLGSRLVVVNDGSKDRTKGLLEVMSNQYGQLKVLNKTNGGHGSSLLYGYKYAIENDADYIFQTDSDGQTMPSEFEEFWEARSIDSAIIGARNQRQDGLHRVFVTFVLKLLILINFRVWIKDPNTPFRLMGREILKKYIDEIPKDYNLTNVLLSIKFHIAKEQVTYIPITFGVRMGGSNSIDMKKIIIIGKKSIKDFASFRKE